MKILLSIIEDLSLVNGTTVRAKKVMDALRSRHNVEVVTRSSTPVTSIAQILQTKPRKIKRVSPSTTKLWNIKTVPPVVEGAYDLIYCVADLFGFLTYFLLAKLLGFKLLFEAHALAHEEQRSLSTFRRILYFCLELFIAKKSDIVVALSKPTYDFFTALNRNVFLVPVFVSEDLHTQKKETPVGPHRRIGIVGPFDSVFNYYQLEFLYQNLNSFNPAFSFSIIGASKKTPHKQIEYKGHLKTRTQYLNELCKLDALLVPVKYPTLGPKNKIIEAMACGIPVFTTHEGIKGLDYAQPGQNIIVGTPETLVELVNTMLPSDQINKIILAAQETINKYYSASSCRRKLLSVLEAVN